MKNLLKKAIAVLFLVILTAYSYGQTTAEKLKNVIGPSPEAASISRYGLYPVGMFTGVPQISIPIYSVKIKDFELPISLSYHASGIKVNDIASSVGLGWNINAGGVITRTVMGLPDEARYQDVFNGKVKREAQITEKDFPYLFEVLSDRTSDSEPDLFYYSFLGKSGKFVLGKDKKALIIPHNNMVINLDDKKNKFSITDSDGKMYFFEKTASNSSLTGTNVNYIGATTSWYMTKIILENKVDSIVFSYEGYNPGNIHTMDFNLTLGAKFDPNGSGGDHPRVKFLTTPEKIDIYENPNTLYLSEIQFPNGKIRFVEKKGRLDFAAGSSLLDSVIVESGLKVVQKTALVYDYFYSDEGFNFYALTQDKYRAKLLKIKNISLGIDTAAYSFEYEEKTKLPPRNNFGVDWWGYSNGYFNNKTLMPLDEFGRQYSYYNETGYTAVSTISDPATRTPNELYMKAGMLKRIYYPTGGYTDFDFEANRIATTKLVESSYGMVNAIAKKDDAPNDLNRIKEFISPIDAAGSLIPNRAYLTVSVPLWNDITQPFAIFENLTKGTYLKLTTYPGEQTFRTIYVDISKGDKCRLTTAIKANSNNPEDNIDESVSLTLNYPPAEPVTSVPDIQIGPGLRVKSIKSYNWSGDQIKQEDYKYGENESGLGSPSFFAYLFKTRTFTQPHFYKYEWISPIPGGPTGGVQIYNHKFLNVLTKPLFNYSDFGGSVICYPVVTKYEKSSSGDNGKTVYQFDLELDDKLDYDYPDAQLLVSGAWKSGNLISEKKYRREKDNSYKLIAEDSIYYKLFPVDTTYGLKIRWNTINEVDGWESVRQQPSLITSTGFRTAFDFFEYPLISGVKKMIKTVNKTYPKEGTSPLVATNIYTYPNAVRLLPGVIETTVSNGVFHKQILRYPFDKATLQGLTPTESIAIDTMVRRNMIENVIEKEEYANTMPLRKSHFEYNLWNTPTFFPALKKFKQKSASSILEDRFEISAYSNGNILEQAKAGGSKEVYLWGYNAQYPVAKIIGSNYETVRGLVNQSVLNNSSTTDESMRMELNKVRIGLKGTQAQVTTYTYKPLVGMTSQTDARGETTTYEYDEFQRLKTIRDSKGHIVKQMDYHYQNQ